MIRKSVLELKHRLAQVEDRLAFARRQSPPLVMLIGALSDEAESLRRQIQSIQQRRYLEVA